MLVVDKMQSIYGTADAWTEERMLGARFSGRRMELKTGHRLPHRLILFYEIVLKLFCVKRKLLLLEPAQGNIDLGPVELR